MKEFDLNIEKILDNWEIYHAVREIIANALDEQQLTSTDPIRIYKEDGVWHIADFGRGLDYHHLTQNENEEKINAENLIGRFGVGLKDALATFYRNGVKVKIRSKFGVITLKKSVKEGFNDIQTLHAQIDEPDDPYMQGTDFQLANCPDDSIEKAKSLFFCFSNEKVLESTKDGMILEKHGIANIYINGVKVATEDNFLFSYNITKLNAKIKKALNRERSNVGRTAYADSVKRILQSVDSETVLERLMKDLENIMTGRAHDEMKWLDVQLYAIQQLTKKPAHYIFITPQESLERRMDVSDSMDDGYKVFVIPDNLKQRATSIDNVMTLEKYIQKKSDTFSAVEIPKKDLSPEESEMFRKIPEILSFMGGIPRNVKSIKITEALYSASDGALTVGLWDSATKTIWIKRSQLRSLKDFANTLIHECTHAESGAGDVSRAFEWALSENLGKQTEFYNRPEKKKNWKNWFK